MEINDKLLYLIALIIIGAICIYGMKLGQFDIGSAGVNGLLGFIGGVGVGATAVGVKSSV